MSQNSQQGALARGLGSSTLAENGKFGEWEFQGTDCL